MIRGLSDADLDARVAKAEEVFARAMRKAFYAATRRLVADPLTAALDPIPGADLDDVLVAQRVWTAEVPELSTHISAAFGESATSVAGILYEDAPPLPSQAVPVSSVNVVAPLGDEFLYATTTLPGLPLNARLAIDRGARAHLAGAVNRLVNVGDAAWRDIRGQLVEGFTAGEGIDDIKRRLRGMSGISQKRARVIARCLPAETLVDGAVVRAVTRRWYEGDFAVVVTESGSQLSATPNHPMLTARGWIPAGEIGEGDHLVRRLGEQDAGTSGDEYVAHPPASIGEVFESVAAVGVLERRRGGHPDFHGDGMDGDVDVACAARELAVGSFAPLYEQVVQRVLADADEASAPLCRQCRRLLSIDQQVCLCRGSRMQSGQAESALNGSSGYSVEFGDPVDRHAVLELAHDALGIKVAALVGAPATAGVELLAGVGPRSAHTCCPCGVEHGALVDAEHVGDLLGAEAGAVQLDRVVSTFRREFRGHVFNLSTPFGYFTTDGYFTGNTEVISASNAGAMMGARAIPELEPETKTWLSAQDARVRASHLAAHGQTVPLDEQFKVGGATLDYPGGPGPAAETISCRCTVTFSDPGEPAPSPIPGPEAVATTGRGVAPFTAVSKMPGPKSAVGAAARQSLDEIAKVHRIPEGMTKVGVTASNARNYAGIYEPGLLKGTPHIRVVASGNHLAGTFTHEFGHFLDHEADLLGQTPGGGRSRLKFMSTSPVGRQNPLMARFFEATDASPSIQALRVARNAPDAGLTNASYYLSKVETWARAYHQWIAVRSGSATLQAEIKAIRTRGGNVALSQWADDEFEPIARALDAIFKEAGLLE